VTDRDIVVVGFTDAELVDIACVTSAFDLANMLGAEPGYRVRLATVGGAEVVCASGLTLQAQTSLEVIRRADTLVVSGGRGHPKAARDPALVQQVRRLADASGRVASVCTGAMVLAAAGLLDGRRATTHWFYAEELARCFPAVQVDADPVYIRDGRLATSGGVTASLDLTLAFIEEDHGAEFARRVAMGMVTYLHRPGNQAQMSIFTATPRPDDLTLRELIDYVVAHPDDDLSVGALAARTSISPRQLTRLFSERLGTSPGATVRRIRLELAARLIAATDLPLSQVASRSGFGSAESLRQAFVARYGLSPLRYRQSHHSTVAAR
jgi:transcriptional regulator GlxA family with amidase domain